MRTLAPPILVLALVALAGAASAQEALRMEARAGADAEATAAAPAAPAAPALPAAPEAPLDAEAPFDVGALSVPVEVEAEARVQATAPAPRAGGGGWLPFDADALGEALGPAVAEAAPPVLATAGFLALLQALGIWRVLGVGAFAMYSRLAKSELLDNEHRDRVYQLIRASPGLGVSEIAQRSGLGWGTTVYHLDRLERAQMVASERSGLHRCYFPVGAVAREERRAIGALKGGTTRTVAELLVRRPGVTQTELCDALGMSASAASKQITKLESAGLVRREREWKTVRLFPEGPLPDLVGAAPAPSPAAAPAAIAA